MSPDQFRENLRSFRKGALAGRNLFLWLGREPDLMQILGSERVAVVSATELVAGLPAGATDGAPASVIQSRLVERLRVISDDLAIVVVRHCGILARYVSDYRPLFEWLTSRRLMVLAFQPVDVGRLGPIPDGLVVEPMRVADALRQVVPTGQVVEVT